MQHALASRMQNIDPEMLSSITGGYARANPDKKDKNVELALTKLQSSIKDMAKQPPQQNTMLMPMMMAMMMRR